jgi:pimeloyl-ACP methyl ester carboxylesterase
MTFAILIASVLLAVQSYEMLKIPTAGAEAILGRLSLPAEGFKNVLVIDVPGSGPNTYENRRRIGRTTEVRYHDLFAAELARRGVAYFSYSTRYTEVDENTPPTFDRVDKARFWTITPAERTQDLEAIIRHLRKDPRLARCRVLLLGWSEGSIIATLVAERKQVPIDALFLAGVPADDAYSTILWQHSGEASMINMRKFFDTDNDGRITRAEYESGDPRARARVGNKTFDDLDVNQDAVLTADDFRLILKPRLQQILSAVERQDDEWIWTNFFRVGARWISQHREVEPNRTRIPRLDLPVFLFHGTDDANCPVQGVIDVGNRARERGRTSLRTFIIPDHDHSLEFVSWAVSGSLPEGLKILFDQVEKWTTRERQASGDPACYARAVRPRVGCQPVRERQGSDDTPLPVSH